MNEIANLIARKQAT